MMVEYGGATTDVEHLGSAMSDVFSYRYLYGLDVFDAVKKVYKG